MFDYPEQGDAVSMSGESQSKPSGETWERASPASAEVSTKIEPKQLLILLVLSLSLNSINSHDHFHWQGPGGRFRNMGRNCGRGCGSGASVRRVLYEYRWFYLAMGVLHQHPDRNHSPRRGRICD